MWKIHVYVTLQGVSSELYFILPSFISACQFLVSLYPVGVLALDFIRFVKVCSDISL